MEIWVFHVKRGLRTRSMSVLVFSEAAKNTLENVRS